MSVHSDTGGYKVSRSDGYTVDPRGLIVDWGKNLSRGGIEPPVDDALKALALDMMPKKGAGDTEEGTSGQQNPILCRSLSDRRLEVIGGFRRMRAALWLIESGTCPDFRVKYQVTKVSDAEAALINMSENLQREDPKPIQLAHAVRMLTEAPYNLTMKVVAGRLKMSPGYLASLVNLTGLPADIQTSVATGETSVVAGLEIAKLDDISDQLAAFNEAKTTGGKKVKASHVKEAIKKQRAAKGQEQPASHLSLKEFRSIIESKSGPAEDELGRKLANMILDLIVGKKTEKQFNNLWDKLFPVPVIEEEVEESAKRGKKAS